MGRPLSTLAALAVFFAMPWPAAASDWKHVDALEVEDPVIRAVWAAFVDRLNHNDIQGAIQYHVPENRKSVAELYGMFGDRLQDLPDNWTELLEPEMHGPFVTYKIMDQSTGMISGVTFLKYPDGQWLIQSL